MTTIDRGSKITVGLLGGVLAVAIAGLVGGGRFVFVAAGWLRDTAHWREAIERRLASIDAKLSDAHERDWNRSHMRIWSKRLSEMNPEIEMPEIDDIILGD